MIIGIWVLTRDHAGISFSLLGFFLGLGICEFRLCQKGDSFAGI